MKTQKRKFGLIVAMGLTILATVSTITFATCYVDTTIPCGTSDNGHVGECMTADQDCGYKLSSSEKAWTKNAESGQQGQCEAGVVPNVKQKCTKKTLCNAFGEECDLSTGTGKKCLATGTSTWIDPQDVQAVSGASCKG